MLPRSPISTDRGYNRATPALLCRSIPFYFCFSLLFIFLFAASSHAIVYVDKDRPGGNGTSWAQAYKTLKQAIDNNTSSPQEFWIAEGTYTPSDVLLPLKGHSFYGGFAGTETSRNQRNITAHPTVIDGQNALKHVFYVTGLVTTAVRFDGLTIKRGAANAAKGHDDSTGGAIKVNGANGASVVIASCTFLNNMATHMGGAVAIVSSPTAVVTGSTFTNNTITDPTGAGAGVAFIWSQIGSPPSATVEKSTFQGNSAGANGGGIYSLRFPMLVKESTFVSNSASQTGGAIFYDYKLTGSEKIERCKFFGNSSSIRGGAVSSYARSLEIENSVFAHNTSVSGAGVGLHSGLNDPIDPNNYNSSYSAIFRNTTFFNNQASGYGGGIENIGGHPMYIYNSIFWNNQGNSWSQDGGTRTTDDIANHDSSIGVSPVTMRYTDMESLGGGDAPAHVNQVGCFSIDPVLVDPDGPDNAAGTADDNLSIQYTSPCIDRADGNNAAVKDIELRPREDYPAVPNLGTGSPNYGDIGAYEGPSSGPPIVVPPPVVNDGVSVPPMLSLLLNKTLLYEDFEGAWPPNGWIVTDHFGTGLEWQRNDMTGSDNYCLYGSGYSATADSWNLDPAGIGMGTTLTTPPINLFTPQVFLGYASNFQAFNDKGIMATQISIDNGTNWTNLRIQDVDDPPGVGLVIGGTWEVEDLTPYVGNTILLRWVYIDEYSHAWYLQLDNVIVSKEPPPAP